jgi:hypothetical protein
MSWAKTDVTEKRRPDKIVRKRALKKPALKHQICIVPPIIKN